MLGLRLNIVVYIDESESIGLIPWRSLLVVENAMIDTDNQRPKVYDE